MTSTQHGPRTVAPDRIRILEGANPRRRHDPEAERALADSIARHGILSPLLVRPDPDDAEGLVLIAGERRLRAALLAGLEAVPVLVRAEEEGEREDLHLALVENLQRADMDPIEEAEAFRRALGGRITQRALAKSLGVSASLVRERLALLRLPEPVKELIGAGAVPASLAALILRVAKVSAPVAVAMAQVVASGAVSAAEAERDPEEVLRNLERGVAAGEPAPFFARAGAWRSVGVERVLAHTDAPELATLSERLGRSDAYLDQDDADAARAYGCLLEFRRDRYEAASFLTDAAFVADRLLTQMARIAERERQREARAAELRTPSAPSAEDGPEEAEAARRAEREERRTRRESAIAANLDLGAQLAQAFHRPILTQSAMRLLALLVIGREATGIAASGIRYIDPAWQQVEERTLASGETRARREYLEPHAAGERLREWVLAGKDAPAILGRLLQSLAASAYADQEAVAQSKRAYFSLRHHAGGEVMALIEDLAGDVVPQRLAEALRAEQARGTALERMAGGLGEDAEEELGEDEVDRAA